MESLPGWQEEWSQSFRTANDLISQGFILDNEKAKYQSILQQYRFVLTRYYANLIDRKNPDCPIRLQAIPSPQELVVDPNSHKDPLNDLSYKPSGPLTHRYQNRVLIHLTPNCSMYCRYCFRKNLLNELSSELFDGRMEAAFEYVKSHPEINEVIFSGGDPFMASDRFLDTTLQEMSSINHIRRIRIHTRVPVTFPARITDSFVGTLKNPKPIVIVTHFNHPKELTSESVAACKKLLDAGFYLFNQSVLLKKVNDAAEVLCALSEALFDNKIVPYYLHHPDPALGTSHFNISIQEGLRIYNEMRSRLSGYLIPRYVVDDVRVPYKTLVAERCHSQK